ncbi:hypothetical protein BU24DRAFT_429382 [Aaosphaeria arxii CBS 175.79]|uniref:Zn(2)-C6 fungal-type domain-containing protein n=1 Tax=Aaosphaeria arxii CBS 175.79 TaxID=1450172 RepID=A0A6A5X6S1_9PLEO|nr:uncharacterized protein BU24DRAFT_429382 [Aaosphaeria arxii CBS 175.79]KAF2008547.1 hypothetical protein BU24DRAFT_429382 [Aaosphaeria arxii CBS 175.79]
MSTTIPARSQAGRPLSLARGNITACVRCHQKKKRCDQKLPACGLCEAAGVPCSSYDRVAKRQVPRSYIFSLEERVAYLELKLRHSSIPFHDLEDERSTSPSTTQSVSGNHGVNAPEQLPNSCAQHLQTQREGVEAVTSLALDKLQAMAQPIPEREPHFSPLLFSKITQLAKNAMFTPALSIPSAVASTSSSDIIQDLENQPVNLPDEQATQKLVSAYFEFANNGMPLLHEPTFRDMLRRLYTEQEVSDSRATNGTGESSLSLFYAFEIFAIALLVLQKREPLKIPISMADRYHNVALRSLETIGLPSGIEGIRTLLLISQYTYHHPTLWSFWQTIGYALRLATEIGLHSDTPTAGVDALTLDNRRRIFWVAYTMEKNACIAFDLPSCLSDGAITAKFPSAAHDDCTRSDVLNIPDETRFSAKKLNIHLLQYRQIQSEMQSVLHDRPSPLCAQIDWGLWQRGMHDRIRIWYDNVPTGDGMTSYDRKDQENFELSFYRALFYLYKPSTNIPEPSESSWQIVADSTAQMIRLYKRFFDERRLTVYWQAIASLSSARTNLIFSWMKSPKVQEEITLKTLETHVHTCSSVLWGMVEHFPAFKGKRDTFDAISSAVLADISSNASADESPRHYYMGAGFHSLPADGNYVEAEVSGTDGQTPRQLPFEDDRIEANLHLPRAFEMQRAFLEDHPTSLQDQPQHDPDVLEVMSDSGHPGLSSASSFDWSLPAHTEHGFYTNSWS